MFPFTYTFEREIKDGKTLKMSVMQYVIQLQKGA